MGLRPHGPFGVMALTTAVAVAAGATGWLVASRVKSPADAAADRKPPTASLITVPVEERTLTSQVVAQGSVTYGKAQPITLTGTVGGAEAGQQLVTKTTAAGRTLHEGDVLLEINGRPVFVLQGKVPMYRTLVRGGEGDDVDQLRAALRRLLPGRGLTRTGALNDRVLEAVEAWYGRKGYLPIVPTTEQRTQLRQLERAVNDAKTGGGQALVDARADLAEFRKTYGISVPSGEVIFLPKLPTRLTAVSAKVGAAPDGPVGTVADPSLVVNATVPDEDVDLLKIGMAATLQDDAGGSHAATLTGMGAAFATSDDKDGGGMPVRLIPKDATKIAGLNGRSVRIRITVGGTDGAVLSVPVAAIFTASDGQARVTVADSDGGTRDVPVVPGLTAAGNVQVTPLAGESLTAGERVVVSGS